MREADRIMRETDSFVREVDIDRFMRVAVGLLGHREAARLKREREGDLLGEREAEREREIG